MMNDLDAQRLKILEERVSALEHKVGGLTAPVLDAIENFRRDTLALFDGFGGRVDNRILAVDQRLERTEQSLQAISRQLDLLLQTLAPKP